MAQALFFAPLWLLPANPFRWIHFAHAAIAAVFFFTGQVFTFLALSRGDVSVATPVLGTKVILVAGLSALLIGEHLSLRWWLAVLLTAGATALLGAGRSRADRAVILRSLAYGVGAAASFALTDVLQQKWARAWGFTHFAPTAFSLVALFSLGLIPFFSKPLSQLPPGAWRWIIPGSGLLALQAVGVAASIVQLGGATLTNILYSSRGIWTVILVWVAGPLLGNDERLQGRAVMLRRLFGAALLVVAIMIVVL